MSPRRVSVWHRQRKEACSFAGLDSYNAYNVIESLKTLARTFHRTVIFTIHQPQSNIVALFDRLLLLAKGQMVYSGESVRAQEHFEKLEHPCPPGYNIADFLIDLTVEASGDHRGHKGKANGHGSGTRTSSRDAENGFARDASGSDLEDEEGDDTGGRSTVLGQISKKAQRILGAFTTGGDSANSSGTSTPDASQVPEKLASLVLACRASDDAKIVEAEITRIQNGQSPDGTDSRDVSAELEVRGFKKAGWWRQFVLLSGRAFKNLYR
jgi:hypothetical protein